MNIRLTFLLVAVLLLFGGSFAVVALTRSPEPKDDQDWLWRVDDNSIVHIEVTYQGEKVVYDKKPGSSYWFIVEGDGKSGFSRTNGAAPRCCSAGRGLTGPW